MDIRRIRKLVAQYRKRCGGRPLGMIMKMGEGQIDNILTNLRKLEKLKKVKKQFRGDSPRDLQLQVVRENR